MEVRKTGRISIRKEGTASMVLIREGKFKGGRVVFPEWRVAVEMDTSDLIIFTNMTDWHGNTPIVPLSSNYQRCTMVFYYREGMIQCGSAEDELERAKRRQPGESIQKESLNPMSDDEQW